MSPRRPSASIVASLAIGALAAGLLATTTAAPSVGSPRTGAGHGARTHTSDEPTADEVARAAAQIRPALTAAAQRGAATTAVRHVARAGTVVRPAAAASLDDCSAAYGGPFLCGSIQVPTSATDPTLGTRTIDFVYRPADVQPATGVSLFSNGPTQSTFADSSTWKPEFFSWIATGQGAELDHRDVILVNTRGTGRDAIDCPMLQSPGNAFADAVHECATILGRSIDYFTAGDAADDLDAVRAFLLGRTTKVDLVTMGHSTALGQAYLARYPQRVRTAVLDEAVNINEWGNVEINDSTRILGTICDRSARCSAQIDDAVEQLAWLAARVRRSPIVGMTTLADGTPQRIVLGEVELAWGIVSPEAGSYAFGPGLAAAIKSYRAGDDQPLLRIAANAGVGEGWTGVPTTGPDDILQEWSASGFAMANCNEWPQPYDLNADEATRRAQAAARLAAAPATLYGIFSKALYSNWEECWAWPAPKRVNRINPPGTRFADVPVLVLSGDLNTDHPPTAARTVAARYPRATFVSIPRAGQPALFWSACAARVMQHFLDTRAAGDTSCLPTEGKAVLGIGAFPRSVSGEAPARRASTSDRSTTSDRRVVALAVHTAEDAVVQAFTVGADAGPGLRSGSWSIAYGTDGATFTLADDVFVNGVTVNGTVDFSFVADNAPATLTVSGGATQSGTLTVEWPALFSLDHPTAHVTGQIGGRPLDLTVDLH